MSKPWVDENAARTATVALCERGFEDLFGCPVPPGWQQGWLARYKELELVETEAREIARNFGRKLLPVAQKEAADFLLRLRQRPDDRRVWIPIVQELSQYLLEARERQARGEPDEPFALDGTTESFFVAQHPAGRDLLLKYPIVAERKGGVVVELADGTQKKVAGTVRQAFSEHGVKHRRGGDLGALPDFRTLNGFVVYTFELLTADLPPTFPAGIRTEFVYLTDRELAIIAILIDKKELTITAADVRAGKPPGKLLDGHRKKIRSVRRNSGYLHTAGPYLDRDSLLDPALQKAREAWVEEAMTRPEGARIRLPPPKV